MPRAIILVFDSFGVGASADAAGYGDQGANTLKHIAQACAAGKADSKQRQGTLQLPNLIRWGLARAAVASCGKHINGLDHQQEPDAQACYGYAVEQSLGKDTPSGHWEMAGVPVTFQWGYFPKQNPCFPQALSDALITEGQIPGILGNCHASGTVILDQLAEQHIQSGQPIVYTSADSVLQIAAHEQHFGLERLYALCAVARRLVDHYNIGRVIARPFVGEAGAWQRTANRRDYTTPPPSATLLEQLIAHQREVIAIGKIADIFAHRGVSQVIKADGNLALFDATLNAWQDAPDGCLLMTNFVDFDSKYGHRRDISGYAHALECLDARLPELEKLLRADDVVVITADHGCDPTFAGSDHTREHVPVLVFGKTLPRPFIGRRESFADIGQSVAQHLQIPALAHGVGFF